MNKLFVHLVTWNGEKYIPHLFESLKKQTFKDWQLVILDNGSTDKTVEKIKGELIAGRLETNHSVVDVVLKERKENSGFAGGHNTLYKENESEYFLLLNQDMYLDQGCLEKMVEFLDKHEDVAAVSPRLMRWDFEENNFTNKIDSLGLKVFRNRRVIEKYTGKEWDEKKSKLELSFRTDYDAMEVLGVSGAFPMFRRTAIETVEFSDGTFFDSLYNSYKEDIDLAYRLRIAGHKAFVLLDTVAYHDRSAEGLEKKRDKVAIENKKKQSEWIKYHSYKNHLMTIYKNEYFQNWCLDAVFIKWYEMKKFFYFLLFDRSVLKGLGEIWKNRKELKLKKMKVKSMRKVSWKEMRKWWK
ncbi:glycosyltransferase family 2 protein [Candidatus Parcubacteria bacterium]|jgi:GT2 family glycosyltransferase|nr:glycosyltransferase family 2 protein [Candidatus Parcubacteria bacterium]MBT3949093.1 glycosyltransferase family 2 protein [Candidatus Parcubacteria bacterium]